MSAEATPAINWDTHEPTEAVHKASIVMFTADPVDATCFGWVPQAHEALATALGAIDIPSLLGEHWNWWFPNHVATCMCGTVLDAEPGQAVYPALHRHQNDLIHTAILGTTP
jgi:hypothetical protein